jgi:hypothetical protein
LAGAHHVLHIDTCFGEPPEVFFPSLGVNEMVGFVPAVETILDKRKKYAVLLVGTVEERANMPAESTPGKLRGVPGALHILTSTQRAQRRESHVQRGKPIWRRRFDTARSSGATGVNYDERDSVYVIVPPLSTGDSALGIYGGHRRPVFSIVKADQA